MYKHLTRKELRIIEQTKQEGVELQLKEQAEGRAKKGTYVRSIVLFVLIFLLLTLGFSLLISIFS